MASEKVLQSLEILHRELDKISPAIEHINLAREAAEIVKEIPTIHLELINELKKLDLLLKEDIKKQDLAYKNDLKSDFKKNIDFVFEEGRQIYAASKEIQEETKLRLKELEKLLNGIKNLYEKINSINFPERLDKVDSNISGIMAAVQSIQSRIDSLERNITDRLKDLSDFQKELKIEFLKELSTVKSEVNDNVVKTTNELKLLQETFIKKQQTNTYITWALIIIATIAIIAIK